MIDICDVMEVPAEDDHEHWPVNKFQHILAHFSDQVIMHVHILLYSLYTV